AGPAVVVLTASGCATVAALLIALFYRDGPYPFPPRPFSWRLVRDVFERRRWRLATGGYLGHMFELYSFWTWIPVFIGASVAAEGVPAGAHTRAGVARRIRHDRDRRNGLRVGRTCRGCARTRGTGDAGHYAERRVRAAHSVRIRSNVVGAWSARLDVGIFRDRGLGPIQRARDRSGRDARGRDRTHRSEVARILVNDGVDPADSAVGRGRRLAVGVSDPGARTGVRHRRDPSTDRGAPSLGRRGVIVR